VIYKIQGIFRPTFVDKYTHTCRKQFQPLAVSHYVCPVTLEWVQCFLFVVSSIGKLEHEQKFPFQRPTQDRYLVCVLLERSILARTNRS